MSLCDKVGSRHQGRASWNAAGAAPRGGRFVVGAVVGRRQAQLEIARARGDSVRLRHAGGGDSDDWALETRQQGKRNVTSKMLCEGQESQADREETEVDTQNGHDGATLETIAPESRLSIISVSKAGVRHVMRHHMKAAPSS